ncbi:MAG: DUF3320 domain-containing protein [Flavobacterium sp.]|nr:MAG: DUF3320 domain-containing protein [Flavobacterium sp.]
MQETILPKLEASRKELLDLGMRNTLINYKIPKARGIHIVQEKSASIFDILVRQNKAMTFLSRPGKDDDEGVELPELTEEELEDAYNDTKLQTTETEHKLQTKILNTYYFARTSIEEQGVNILYLSLGMLNWYEQGNTQDPRQAPLILIPVSLERSSASERFRLRYTGGDIGANLSLQAKMMADFNITIPDLGDLEDFDIIAYMDDVAQRVKHHELWTIDQDMIELGFFSFGKFMIYHDLDSSKWPENSKPDHHPILNALFGAGFTDPEPTANSDHNLDKETKAHQLFHVVDADSSQVLAMLAVNEGRNLVIQGPPGTGKSQTITNLIANAVGQGKKVLFVAEKMAALEVVKRRLDSINLGEACLELHSHKANKRELHSELKRILELGKPTLTHLENELVELDAYRGKLNGYCNSINKEIAKSGLSGQKVIGYLQRIADQYSGVKLLNLAIPNMGEWDAVMAGRAQKKAEEVEARLKDIGVPASLLFYGTRIKLLLAHERESYTSLIEKALSNTQVLSRHGNEAAGWLLTSPVLDTADIKRLITLSKVASTSPDLRDIAIHDASWTTQYEDLRELLDKGERLNQIRQAYEHILLPEAWSQNVLHIRQNLMLHGRKWYKFIIGDYKRSVKELASFSLVPLPDELDSKIKYTDDILEASRLSAALAEQEALAVRVFGNRWQKVKSRWTELREVLNFLNKVHRDIANRIYPASLLEVLSRNENSQLAKEWAEKLSAALAAQEESMSVLSGKLDFDPGLITEDKRLNGLGFIAQEMLLKQWLERFAEIHLAVQWNNLVETAGQEGFGFLTTAAADWSEASSLLKVALRKNWYEHLITQVMTERPPLRGFERTSHEETIAHFRKLDVLNLVYNRARVALKHYESLPKPEGGGQMSVLRTEFNRKARHMPIRRLMQEAGLAIQTIKPVFMMSPMSIASFLPPGSLEFDLVIFDEASQVRPVEALGAVLRGKQLVVVGDTKQLPPTSFFDKMNTEVEDEDNVTADMQSILGMADSQGAPQRMLRWHYRSRHESLISLSNHEFYENKLVIFPSPGSKLKMGLAFHHLPRAVYDRGKTRSNPIEAEAVADAVIQHALQHPKQSLGVVAFSTAQMQAIQNALEIKRRQHPEVEGYFRSHADEPFFVKNLENVQGDERDVIFISIGYGRIEDGKVPMSFGPLNNEGGERRLNVLITRSKYRCEVFTNITADDITTTATTKFGIRALKSFLYFAQFGKFVVDQDIAIRNERPFEEMVAHRLTAEGYTVRNKVGSEGFYIDLGVVDPDYPGRYILGIDCDGESYGGSKSARDRDRLRKQVLSGIGWKMYHIWSTEWYRNPEREFQRLLDELDKVKAQTFLDDQVEEELVQELKSLLREEKVDVDLSIPMYEKAVVSLNGNTEELHLIPFGKLGQWIDEVVKVESPVHFDEMARRIADAASISKIGSRIRYTLEAACTYAEGAGLVIRKGDFLWHPSKPDVLVRSRLSLSGASKKLSYISPEEMTAGIVKVVKESIAIQPEVAVPLVAKLFGFSRVTEEMKKELLAAIELNISSGHIKKEGELLKEV